MTKTKARTRALLLGMCAGFALAAPGMRAQTAPASPAEAVKAPAYDVVSIKPNNSGSGHVSVSVDDGNFMASNVSLKTMLLSAYGLKEAQIVDLPKWGDSARFDIEAKVIDPDKKVLEALTPEQSRAMQQPILTDRFQLKFHREMKMLPVYELVVGKGGPKFQATTAEEMVSASGVNGVRAGGVSAHINRLTGTIVATGVPLSSLANELSGQLSRMVVDETGLKGKYNLQLRWSREDAGSTAADAPPDIFTALQEQLGLKLRPGNAEVETFVVDSAALPSPN